MEFNFDYLSKYIIDNLTDGVYIVDKKRKILYWNSGAVKITGYSSNEVVGRHCYENILQHVDEKGNKLCFGGCPLEKTNEDGIYREANVFLHHKDGYRVPVLVKVIPLKNNDNEIIGSVEVFADNSHHEEILEKLKELEKMAMTDVLTQLPNRRYINNFLETKIGEFNRFGWTFAIAMIDVDFFKKVNDTYGHDIGDEILKLVAKTFINNLRKIDTIGRYGGEEFIGIFSNQNAESILLICEKLRILVENSKLQINGADIGVTISIGVTIVKESDTMDSLLKRADDLVYKSKLNGRNIVTIG